MEQVTMTPEELIEYEAFKAEKAKKDAAEKARQNREAYKSLVNETIESVFPVLEELSAELAAKKRSVYNAFQNATEMKQELYGTKREQGSNTFTNDSSTLRIILGQYSVDDYDDTVNEGIEKVRSYIASLSHDKESGILVAAVMKLLSRDQKGNIKASRVMQLRKMANESGNDEFKDGVNIIEASYRPAVSKLYIRAEKKNKIGQWVSIPLGMTEAN
jgi:hypothetical protein